MGHPYPWFSAQPVTPILGTKHRSNRVTPIHGPDKEPEIGVTGLPNSTRDPWIGVTGLCLYTGHPYFWFWSGGHTTNRGDPFLLAPRIGVTHFLLVLANNKLKKSLSTFS